MHTVQYTVHACCGTLGKFVLANFSQWLQHQSSELESEQYEQRGFELRSHNASDILHTNECNINIRPF